MRPFFLTLFFSLAAAGLWGQTTVNRITFSFDFEIMGTYTLLEAVTDDTQGRFDRGAGIGWHLHYRLSPLLSLDAGLGVRSLQSRQRYTGLRLGSDLPVALGGNGRQSYLDSRVVLNHLTLPLGVRVRPNRAEEGLYLRPSLELGYRISTNNTRATIYENADAEGFDVEVPTVSAPRIMALPGLAVGITEENDRGKSYYFEVRLAVSAGRAFAGTAAEASALDPAVSASLLTGGAKVGWVIGHGKRERKRLKKERPAPTPTFYPGY